MIIKIEKMTRLCQFDGWKRVKPVATNEPAKRVLDRGWVAAHAQLTTM